MPKLFSVKAANDRVATGLSVALSSMWMFWILSVLVLLALVLQRPSGAQGWVLFVVSVFFQGVALPVLAFVSNQQGDRTEGVLRETHDASLEELATVRDMNATLLAEVTDMRAMQLVLYDKLDQLLARPSGTFKEDAGTADHTGY